ncbi:MAG: cation transporter [Eubacteriales bacterium]
MKKVFRIENLDCAVCAAKVEDGIKKIEGVDSASVSFMTGRLVIEAAEDVMEQVVERAMAVCKKIEPDCVVKAK